MAKLRTTSRPPSDPVSLELIAELDKELLSIYPTENFHPLKPEEMRRFEGVFLVAWLEDEPVACGALRPLEEGVVELKRMYVRAPARGNGLGRELLEHLEGKAVDGGFRIIRLETGTEQSAAISLYETSGYRRIPRFGEYTDCPISVCFEKSL